MRLHAVEARLDDGERYGVLAHRALDGVTPAAPAHNRGGGGRSQAGFGLRANW